MEEDSLPQGVPKVLYSEQVHKNLKLSLHTLDSQVCEILFLIFQAEKRYQEIMGVEKRPNFIGGAPPRMAYQVGRQFPIYFDFLFHNLVFLTGGPATTSRG